jgi:hypothetical protein
MELKIMPLTEFVHGSGHSSPSLFIAVQRYFRNQPHLQEGDVMTGHHRLNDHTLTLGWRNATLKLRRLQNGPVCEVCQRCIRK